MNRINPDEPRALAGYYQTFPLANEAAPEDAIIALESAFTAAPFDNGIRRILGHLLITEKRDDQAKAVISPLAYQPHADAKTRKLRDLLLGLDRDDRQPLIDELAPTLKKPRQDSL